MGGAYNGLDFLCKEFFMRGLIEGEILLFSDCYK